MTPKRKKVEEYIISNMNQIDPSKKNGERYKRMFAKMSDAEFHQYMLNIKEHKEVLFLYVANMVDKLSIENLRDQADRLGVELFERLWLWDQPTKTKYLTQKKYFVADWPIRRFSQFVDHKLSVGESDTTIDLLTGQIARGDKAGGISQVEVQALYSKNLTNTILELIKYRGGDIVAMAEFRRELEEQGRTTVGRDTGSVVRSAVVLSKYFEGMHIESNVVEGV